MKRKTIVACITHFAKVVVLTTKKLNNYLYNSVNILGLSLKGVKFNGPVFIDRGFRAYNYSNITIMSFVSLGHDNHFWAFNKILIGPYVQTAKDLLIISGGHDTQNYSPLSGSAYATQIGAGCWIGARVTIIAGVDIGKGSIIGAGSVVVKSIPPFSIAAGNPCQVIKKRKPNNIIHSPFGLYSLSFLESL